MKITKPILVIIALLLFVSSVATAQTKSRAGNPSPNALVADLYKQHKKRSPFFQTRSRALVDRYFDKHLADLIWKDAKTSKGEVGALDGDPLYNAQDMQIKKFAIHKSTPGSGTAEVKVTFTNFNKPDVITFQLVSGKSGWKISNIQYRDGADLLGLLEGAEGNRTDREHFFEGNYLVGSATCAVKPIKMAFEVKCTGLRAAPVFFYENNTDGKFTYSSEDKGKGVDKFVFDDDRSESGQFIGADKLVFPVKKIK